MLVVICSFLYIFNAFAKGALFHRSGPLFCKVLAALSSNSSHANIRGWCPPKPARLASVDGAVVMGLGGALFEQIDFDSARIRKPHFAQYRLPRFSDMAPIEAVMLDRMDIEPTGAGETPMFGLAPAIGNAIFDATGIRLRALPLVPNGLDLRKA